MPLCPRPGLAAHAQQLMETGAQGARPSGSPDVPARLTSLLEKSQVWMPAALLLGDCFHCRGLDPGPKPAKQLGSKQNRAASSSKSQLSPTTLWLILHLACRSLSLLLSHFLMHFCLATKHELCYQGLIS